MALGEYAGLVAPHDSFKKAGIDLAQDNKIKKGRKAYGIPYIEKQSLHTDVMVVRPPRSCSTRCKWNSHANDG
jgi:hypothetical protein